ncbi:MAG TPA: HEAT repeat domain-containing protein [Gemmatimonadales bacterium]|nr:HEAT repeat domain-containing protein [Gemmatimonadales bacterium]
MAAALATVLVRVRHARTAARWAAVEEAWEPRLLAVLTGDVPAATLLEALTPAERPYFVDFLGRFARRVTGPERDRLLEVARPLLPEIRAGLRAPLPSRRARSADLLGVLGPAGELADLRAALEDSSPLVAMVAARALARLGGEDHARLLVAHLHRFAPWRPSHLAAMLAAVGPEAARPLRVALEDLSLPSRARAVVADALALLNDAESGDAAVTALRTTDDPELRAAALRLLARVGHAEHLPAVREMAAAPEEAVRLAAVRALGALGAGPEVPLLAAALRDPSRWVAEQAARALAAGPGRTALLAAAGRGGPVALLAREALLEGGA